MEEQEPVPPLRRILQVDDDEDILLISRLALEGHGGLEVRTATSGLEGLAVLAEWRPQLAILDWMMPVMDGLECLRAMRRLPEGASLPVIFLTASVSDARKGELVEAGALAVLPKPFDAREWPRTILELWSRHVGERGRG